MGEKENSEYKPVKLRLKIDLVSYPARAEGLVNMDRKKTQKISNRRWKERQRRKMEIKKKGKRKKAWREKEKTIERQKDKSWKKSIRERGG